MCKHSAPGLTRETSPFDALFLMPGGLPELFGDAVPFENGLEFLVGSRDVAAYPNSAT